MAKLLTKSKSDFIEEFRKNLLIENICPNSTKNYVYELKRAFFGQEFSSVRDIEPNKIELHMKQIRGKKSANNLKIALKKFKELNPDFKYDDFSIDIESSKKSNRKLTRFKNPFDLSRAMHKVNSLQNDRFKLSYKLMFNGALRVDEASQVTKNDFKFTDDGIFVHVDHGKAGISRDVKLIDSTYFEDKLPDFLEKYKPSEKLFYSANYLKVIANRLDFQCHDLRRASAQAVYKQNFATLEQNHNPYINKTSPDDLAIEAVKNHLGHTPKSSIYKKYLSRKINFDKTKWK